MLTTAPLTGAAWIVSSSDATTDARTSTRDADGDEHRELALDDRVGAWAARYRVIVGWRAGTDDAYPAAALHAA